MAVPEDDMSVVSVNSSVNIKALLTVVSDVSSASTIEGKSLVNFVLVWSGNSGDSNSEFVSLLVRKSIVSSLEGSDSS